MPVATLPDADWIRDVLADAGVEGVELRPWDLRAEPPDAQDIEMVVPPYMGSLEPLHRLSKLPNLRVVQLLSAGYDSVVAMVPPGVDLANAAGVHDASTAELAVALTLASLRGIPEFVRAQRTSRWLDFAFWPALADKRVLVLGYGSIGRAVAVRLAPFEVELTAVASRPRVGDALVARVHGVDDLARLLPAHDVIVVVVPLSERTRGMVDADFLAAMPDGALLVNVARGKVVDTEALVAETASGRLRAALDVTDPEPLPAEHPLWRIPGVLISPHVGGGTSAFRPRAVALLRRQLRTLAAGEPMANVVHRG